MFCQSCTMPIDNPEDRGSEKNGTVSQEFCKYCYKDGAFTNPGLSLDEMKKKVESEMRRQRFPDSLIQKALTALPYLKRWNKKLG